MPSTRFRVERVCCLCRAGHLSCRFEDNILHNTLGGVDAPLLHHCLIRQYRLPLLRVKRVKGRLGSGRERCSVLPVCVVLATEGDPVRKEVDHIHLHARGHPRVLISHALRLAGWERVVASLERAFFSHVRHPLVKLNVERPVVPGLLPLRQASQFRVEPSSHQFTASLFVPICVERFPQAQHLLQRVGLTRGVVAVAVALAGVKPQHDLKQSPL